MIGRQLEFKIFIFKNRQRSRSHITAWFLNITAVQHLDGARFTLGGLEVALQFEIYRGGINHLTGGDGV